MDLKQLEHFVTAADEQHFTRAALRLHIVQSGLSASIRALEEELGAPLFLRTTRRVVLTPLGRAFVAEARRVLTAASDARQVVADLQGLRRGRLSIGSIQGLAPWLDLPDLLGRFRAACPGVEIRLTSGGSTSLMEGVREGELDLAFVQFLGSTPPDVTAWMLACEPLVAACAPAHWLAGRHDVSLADLAGETFVDLTSDWSTRQLVDQSFLACRVGRHIGFEVDDIATQLDLVGRGLGIALMPGAVVGERNRVVRQPLVASAKLIEPEPCWELAVVFAHSGEKQPVSAVTRMFLDAIRSALALEETCPASSFHVSEHSAA
jgi:DNA-binding transcriptional LysR family regulator